MPEVAYGLSFYPRGMNIELFFLPYGIDFPDRDRFSKLPYMGMHSHWNVKNVQEVAYRPSFCLGGSKLSLFSLYGHRFLGTILIFSRLIRLINADGGGGVKLTGADGLVSGKSNINLCRRGCVCVI